MKTTLSIIKADIGSIGGHIRPSQRLVEEVRNHVASKGKGMVIDFFISHTRDDMAILFSHGLGKGSEKIHQLAWDAFVIPRSLGAPGSFQRRLHAWRRRGLRREPDRRRI